jgi:hypothetical protein
MVIRIRYQKEGGHIHCRVFTAPVANQTFAKCGDVVFDEREWPEVLRTLGSAVQFIPEGVVAE